MSEIPALVKVMTLAIFNRFQGSEESRFKDAFQATRSQLCKFLYLTKDSEKGPMDEIKLTAEGKKRNRLHESRRADLAKFDALYRKHLVVAEVE
jgi:hypothetical protein